MKKMISMLAAITALLACSTNLTTFADSEEERMEYESTETFVVIRNDVENQQVILVNASLNDGYLVGNVCYFSYFNDNKGYPLFNELGKETVYGDIVQFHTPDYRVTTLSSLDSVPMGKLVIHVTNEEVFNVESGFDPANVDTDDATFNIVGNIFGKSLGNFSSAEIDGEEIVIATERDGTKIQFFRDFTFNKEEHFGYDVFPNEYCEILPNSTGDMDDDGEVNASDAADILEYSSAIGVGNSSTLNRSQIAAADLNGDEEINAEDSAIILSYAAEVGSGNKVGTLEEYAKG